MATQVLQSGDFVRVKAECVHRPGQDGMAVAPSDGSSVGLLFGVDRYGRDQSETGAVITGLAEAFGLHELDLTSIEH